MTEIAHVFWSALVSWPWRLPAHFKAAKVLLCTRVYYCDWLMYHTWGIWLTTLMAGKATIWLPGIISEFTCLLDWFEGEIGFLLVVLVAVHWGLWLCLNALALTEFWCSRKMSGGILDREFVLLCCQSLVLWFKCTKMEKEPLKSQPKCLLVQLLTFCITYTLLLQSTCRLIGCSFNVTIF
jgi:hypothetical protein